jgi:hypothetical protein
MASKASMASPSAALVLQGRPEQRLPHDGQGQAHHLRGRVDLAHGLQPVGGGVGVGRHGRDVGGEPGAGERRLHEPAAPQVIGSLAGQQAVAEEHARPLQGEALVEAALAGDQDLPRELRAVEQVGPVRAESERGHVPPAR